MKEPGVERFPSQKNCKVNEALGMQFSRLCAYTRGCMRSTRKMLRNGGGVIHTFFALWMAWALVPFAYAQEIQELGTTEIVAEPVTLAEVAPSYQEILPSSWEGRGMSAAEVLSALPGIQSYKQGGMGSFQTVSVRGIAARNILICIDGVPMNDAGGGATSLASIDLNNVEKIEIYKDRVPAKFGGAGLGGAINFVTKSAIHRGGRSLASVCNHNTFEGSAQVSLAVNDSIQFSATASMRHSDNDYEFENRAGTEYNEEDDFIDKRNNAQFTQYSGNVQYRILHDNGYFSTVSASMEHSEAGNPGREDSQTKVAKFTGDGSQVSYRLETTPFFDMMLLEAGLAAKFEKNISSSYYPLDYIGYVSNDYLEYGLAGYRLLPELLGTFVFERMEANVRLSASLERWEARGSIREFGLDRYAGSVAADAEYAVTEWFSFFAEGNVQKVVDDTHGGMFLMTTGTEMIDDAEKRDMNFAGMVQAKFGKKDSFFGGNLSIGRFYREPQLMELYGVYQGVLSNPKLQSETALKLEAGAFVATPKNTSVLHATYFESFIENGIYWISNVNLMKAFNIGKAHVRGLEVELESKPTKWFETVMRATIQNPRDEGDNKIYNGKLLPGEPVHSYYSEAKIYLPLHLDATFAVDYRTRIYSDRANTIRMPDAVHYNATLGWNILSATRMTFAVNNISDETYANVYSPYPTPGREYRLTLTQGL